MTQPHLQPEPVTLRGSIVLIPNPATGNIIFVERKGFPQKLGVLPGGKVEPDESYRDAGIREFFEETGLTLTSISDAPIFHGIAAANGAPCSVFLGRVEESAWQQIEQEGGFMGPEKLLVRAGPWYMAAREESAEFAEFNKRCFEHLRENHADLRDLFQNFGLSSLLDTMISTQL